MIHQTNYVSPKPLGVKQRAFYFSKSLIFFIHSCRIERFDYSLFDQLMRSGTSIGANLVEGRAGASRKDWRNFYSIALKSANETKYWLCLIKDILPNKKETIEILIKEADEISKIIATILIKTQSL